MCVYFSLSLCRFYFLLDSALSSEHLRKHQWVFLISLSYFCRCSNAALCWWFNDRLSHGDDVTCLGLGWLVCSCRDNCDIFTRNCSNGALLIYFPPGLRWYTGLISAFWSTWDVILSVSLGLSPLCPAWPAARQCCAAKHAKASF